MTIQKGIEEIKDPQKEYGYSQHKLVAIIAIAFCAIICGAKDRDAE